DHAGRPGVPAPTCASGPHPLPRPPCRSRGPGGAGSPARAASSPPRALPRRGPHPAAQSVHRACGAGLCSGAADLIRGTAPLPRAEATSFTGRTVSPLGRFVLEREARAFAPTPAPLAARFFAAWVRTLAFTTPTLGQRASTTQRSQAGARAIHVLRPCHTRS